MYFLFGLVPRNIVIQPFQVQNNPIDTYNHQSNVTGFFNAGEIQKAFFTRNRSKFERFWLILADFLNFNTN
jgi:TnpA family transposase